MELTLTREALLKPLQAVMGVVEQKQTLPILSNVLLNIDANTLSITGTDLEVELIGEYSLDEPIAEKKQITLPGRKLIDICKALPENAPISLYQDKHQVILKSGQSRFTLSSLPADEFPNMEVKKGLVSFSVPEQELRLLLQRTSFAMAHHDVRYYLNGILFEITPQSIRAVATDGHRLAMNTINVNTGADHKLQVIVPRKVVLELIRLLGDAKEDVNVCIGSSFISLNKKGYQITSKLIEGRFPEYERVIPKRNDKEIALNKNEFKCALQRSAILCNEKFRGVRFEISKGLLKIMASNPEHEAVEEKLAIDYSAEDLSIGFNVNYLIENLNVLASDQIILSLAQATNSMILKEVNTEHDSVFVIMPIRL